jgi:hypothetical protein
MSDVRTALTVLLSMQFNADIPETVNKKPILPYKEKKDY